MSNSKTKKIVSIAALVLCLALVATFVLAFTACDEETANAGSEVTPAEKTGFVYGGSGTPNEFGDVVYDEPPITMDSEVIETVRVENDAVTDVSEFDENGVATCAYEGKSMYLTLGGGVYDFYPYSYTLAPVKMTADTAEIQVSFIYNDRAYRNGTYFEITPKYVEVSSLTGEPLDIAYIASRSLLCYLGFDEHGVLIVVDHYEGRVDEDLWLMSTMVQTDTVRVYGNAIQHNDYSVLRIELENGDSYSYGFNCCGFMFDPTKRDEYT